MKIIEPGHIYELNWLDKDKEINTFALGERVYNNYLIFVNRELGTEHPGTQTQEVIRALIDRTKHCNHCLRWEGNDHIIHHLRMALVLHEARALERKTEKKYIEPELIETGPDGHFKIEKNLL